MTVGPFVKWTNGSLRIVSGSLSSTEISSALGLEPTRISEKGAPLSPRLANSRIRDESVWVLEDGLSDDVPLGDHLSALLDVIEPRLAQLQQLAARAQIEIVLGFGSESGQGGDFLTPDVLRRAADVGLAIEIYLYPGDVLPTA